MCAPCPTPAPGQGESTPAVDPANPEPSHPQVSPKVATAFVHAATDTFWEIEKALNEYKAMETSLKKAKKDVAIIIRSARQAFPGIDESVNLLGGQAGDLQPQLEVEMR